MNQPVHKPYSPPACLTWQDRAMTAAEGTMTGAILRAALGHPIARTPRFGFKAIITVDGHIMCDFTDVTNEKHVGAYVCPVDALATNIVKLADFLALPADDRRAMFRAVDGWIARDYRDLHRPPPANGVMEGRE